MSETFIEDGRKRARVQAVRFTGNFDDVERFVGGDCEWRKDHFVVASRQGALKGAHGDWIVREVSGLFVVYPPHLFHDAYRPAPSPSTTGGDKP